MRSPSERSGFTPQQVCTTAHSRLARCGHAEAVKHTGPAPGPSQSNDEIATLLKKDRQEVESHLQDQFKQERSAAPDDGRDVLERSEADSQATVGVALLAMRAERLSGVDAALLRLERGEYGLCTGCGRPISRRRLRALPTASRCHSCEEGRETARSRKR